MTGHCNIYAVSSRVQVAQYSYCHSFTIKTSTSTTRDELHCEISCVLLFWILSKGFIFTHICIYSSEAKMFSWVNVCFVNLYIICWFKVLEKIKKLINETKSRSSYTTQIAHALLGKHNSIEMEKLYVAVHTYKRQRNKAKFSYSLFLLGSLSLTTIFSTICKEMSVDQKLVEYKNPDIPWCLLSYKIYHR